MPKKRANGEGTLGWSESKGLWAAAVTLSRNPATGKVTRRWVYGKTQAEARAKLNQLKKQQAEGTLRAPDRTTMREWAETYLENARGRLKAATYQSYRANLDSYVLPYIGHIRLEKLTARDVAAMVDTLARERGTRTSQYARTLTSMMLNYAVSLDLIPRNVAKNTRPPKAQRQEMKFWQPHEVRTFLQAIEGHRFESLFKLALATGMRKAELLGIRWQDLSGDTLSVRQTVVRLAYDPHIDTPKTHAGARDLILDPDTLQALAERRSAYQREREAAGENWQDFDLIFANLDGTPMIPWRLDHTWRALRAGAEVESIRFHDLRHTYASLAIASGMDVRMLAERLGHADASVTLRIYAHVFQGQRRRAAMSLGSLLDTAEREVWPTADATTRTTTGTDEGEHGRTDTDEKAV